MAFALILGFVLPASAETVQLYASVDDSNSTINLLGDVMRNDPAYDPYNQYAILRAGERDYRVYFGKDISKSSICYTYTPSAYNVQAKWDAFDNPEVMHQITDLQVLDYICGNTDRHTGNMVYQFRRSGSGKIILGGIKGIDNDCSFGTPDIKGRDQIMKLVKPENMMYITKEMRSTLEKIKKPMLKTVLANDKLSDEEILEMIMRDAASLKETVLS